MSLIESDLSQFYGTANWFRMPFPFRNMFLTDGANFVAKKGKALWLMQAICSHQIELLKDRTLRSFQLWTLKVENKAGVLTCQADSDQEPVVTQEIESTDFSLPHIEFYVCPMNDKQWVIMLPSEY